MIRHTATCVVAAVCTMLVGCGPGGSFTATIPLDQATGVLTIRQSSTETSILAVLTNSLGTPVELEDGQAVYVNAIALDETGITGLYRATIELADSYTIRVHEPTRGVSTTEVIPPAAFEITSHADNAQASLSGFTLTWSNADPSLQVRIELQQNFNNTERELDPVTDSGTYTLSPDDLQGFQQGDNLVLTLIKSGTTNVNGFDNGQVTVERSTQVILSPAP